MVNNENRYTCTSRSFIEHKHSLDALGVESFEIRQKKDIEKPFDGLIIPGGESTVIGKLLHKLDLYEPIKNMIENGMVMPTDVNFDRKRQRKVVFYGRVSTEHEAQLAALENQIQWYDDIAAKNPNWYILKKYIDEGIIYGGTKIKNLRNRSNFFTEIKIEFYV